MSMYDSWQWKTISPFFSEPDFEAGCAYGLHYWMQRNSMKAWCGYVGIPKSHPWFGLSYGDEVYVPNRGELQFSEIGSPIAYLIEVLKPAPKADMVNIDVLLDAHGGITWSGDHKPRHYPDGLWWFGFDCSHAWDTSPQDMIRAFVDPYDSPWRLRGDSVYRDHKYVRSQCFKLASQLSDITSAFPEKLIGAPK